MGSRHPQVVPALGDRGLVNSAITLGFIFYTSKETPAFLIPTGDYLLAHLTSFPLLSSSLLLTPREGRLGLKSVMGGVWSQQPGTPACPSWNS